MTSTIENITTIKQQFERLRQINQQIKDIHYSHNAFEELYYMTGEMSNRLNGIDYGEKYNNVSDETLFNRLIELTNEKEKCDTIIKALKDEKRKIHINLVSQLRNDRLNREFNVNEVEYHD